MKRLTCLLFVLPFTSGCAFFGGNAVRISGEALSVKTEVPEHSHVQVDGQCLTCLRHTSEDLTDRVNALEVQLNKYEAFSEAASRRMVEKLTSADEPLRSTTTD